MNRKKDLHSLKGFGCLSVQFIHYTLYKIDITEWPGVKGKNLYQISYEIGISK